MNEELKPCPFCGGQIQVEVASTPDNKHQWYEIIHVCPSQIEVIITGKTSEEVENKWNTRW